MKIGLHNQYGMAHWLAPIAVVVVIGAVGARTLFAAHAAPAVTQTATKTTTFQGFYAGWQAHTPSGTTFQSTTTSWTEPVLNCTASPNGKGDVQIWAGLQGSISLYQTGASGGCAGGKQYEDYGWIDFFTEAGGPPIQYSYPAFQGGPNGFGIIEPGDHMTATVTETATAPPTYKFTLKDVTQDVTGSHTIACPSGSTCANPIQAESVTEPTTNSTDPGEFDTNIQFTKTTATTFSGITDGLVSTHWNSVKLLMTNESTTAPVTCAEPLAFNQTAHTYQTKWLARGCDTAE